MSGWNARARAFDLTATKAQSWHRGCNCGSDALADMFRRHLAPAGLRAAPSPSVHVLRVAADGRDPAALQAHIYGSLRAEINEKRR